MLHLRLLPSIALLTILAPSGPLPLAADAPEAPTLVPLAVQVSDLRNGRGHLRLGVFNSARGFPRERDGAILWQTMPANSTDTRFIVDLPPGDYAVVVLHDENGNKKLDTNLLGVPKEGYGVSNNPKPKLRAARFDEAVFRVGDDGADITVSVQYF